MSKIRDEAKAVVKMIPGINFNRDSEWAVELAQKQAKRVLLLEKAVRYKMVQDRLDALYAKLVLMSRTIKGDTLIELHEELMDKVEDKIKYCYFLAKTLYRQAEDGILLKKPKFSF